MLARTFSMTFALAMALSFAPQAQAQSTEGWRHHRHVKESVSIAPVITLPTATAEGFEELDGTTVLTRTKTGVGFLYNTKDLEPNAPYTVWWVTFNRPRRCFEPYQCGAEDFANAAAQPGVFFATGRTADAQGQANFAGQVDYGELPDGEDQVPFPDLDRPIWPGAEIHLVIRAHGPALPDPADLNAQLTQFNGGCPPNDCVDVQASIHQVKKLRWH